MILKFKRNEVCNGAAYKCLADDVFGKGIEVRALSA